ncbi:SLC13 family permease [Marinobacter halodurans]|uniref:SLC13 family permease n=1 Tax=Marinobacter halodurans TaxID=2528979 RepID=UPI001F61CC1F|nr:SLC13 family permease [Marinobacter halodurans]
MTWEAITTVGVLSSVLIALALTRVSADLVLMAALTILLLTGILSPTEALAGFANPGVITIAVLYIVAAGRKETGAVQWVARLLIGKTIAEAGLRALAYGYLTEIRA